MTAKVKVTLDIQKDLRALFDRTFKDEVGTELIEMIKEFLERGVSPVRGERKFAAYKDPDKYPAGKKSKTPVNLELTQDMLDALIHWFVRDSIRIGFKDDEQQKKAQTHQYGLNEVPKRPILPVEEGQEFNVTITQQLLKIYSDKILDIIRKSNR